MGDLFGASFGSAAFAEVAAANGTSLGAEVFNAFMGNPTEAIIYGLIFVALTMLIVMGGVSGGIEKVCSVGMPALFVMLLICIVRACTLPDAVNGLKYMFVPGWAVANGIIRRSPQFPDRAFHRRRSDVLLPVSGHGHYDHLRLLSG